MYVFGVVLSDADETPIGRASVALKAELPSLFPEHGFEFLGEADRGQVISCQPVVAGCDAPTVLDYSLGVPEVPHGTSGTNSP
jgi:hypothetical protein